MANNTNEMELRDELIAFYQRTIDLDDPDRQYIGYLADRSIEMTRKHFSQYVKLPLSMQDVANYCGVSRQTLYSWVKDPGSIKAKHLAKLIRLEESSHGE